MTMADAHVHTQLLQDQEALGNNVKAKICLTLRGRLTQYGVQRGQAQAPIAHPLRATLYVLSDAEPLTTTWRTLKQDSPRCGLGQSPITIFLQQSQPQSQRTLGGGGGGLLKTRHEAAILLLAINNANKVVKTVPKFTLTGPRLTSKTINQDISLLDPGSVPQR